MFQRCTNFFQRLELVGLSIIPPFSSIKIDILTTYDVASKRITSSFYLPPWFSNACLTRSLKPNPLEVLDLVNLLHLIYCICFLLSLSPLKEGTLTFLNLFKAGFRNLQSHHGISKHGLKDNFSESHTPCKGEHLSLPLAKLILHLLKNEFVIFYLKTFDS